MPAPKPDQDAEALKLRLAGFSYDDIASRLGYANRSGAWKAVERARSGDVEPDVAALEVQRLDMLQRGLMTKALGGDVQAVLAVVRIIEQRAKLSGFYTAQPAVVEPEKKGTPLDELARRRSVRQPGASRRKGAAG